jgi:flagellar M-ring protein FliF
VQGLKADKVTITDSTGQLLWPAGDAAGAGRDGVGAGSSKQAAEARFDSAMEARLNAMLAQTLGRGKAQVQVTADLDVDRTTRHELVYSKKGVPEELTTDEEKLNGASGAAGGTAGAGANIPTYSAGTAGGGAGSKYQHTVKTQKNALNKRVTETDVAPGAVNKLSVALVLDKSVPAAVAKSIQSTVASAAGIDPKRGDVVSLSQYAFAKPAAPKSGPVPTSLLGPIKWVGLGPLVLHWGVGVAGDPFLGVGDFALPRGLVGTLRL